MRRCLVRGLDIFQERFAAYVDQYVLIGGTAASLTMEEAGLEFRATKDLDWAFDSKQFGNPLGIRSPGANQSQSCGAVRAACHVVITVRAASDYRIDARMLDAPFECPNCRRSYSPSWSSFTRCRRLQAHERTAVTRTFIGC